MKKSYDSLDITKFICSIMIVAIHAQLFPMVLYPWLRLAVPLFFVIGSFLFFSKIRSLENDRDEISYLKHYVKRQLYLYVFWFIILLPMTIYTRREWFSDGGFKGCLIMIRQFLWNSTFTASWFITASIIGTVIVYWLSRKFSNSLLITVGGVLYLLCCLRSCYIHDISAVTPLRLYENIFSNPVFSFPVAIIWISIGKLFAEHKVSIDLKRGFTGFVVSAVLLYLEWRLVYGFNGSYNNDCYVMLVPCVFFAFSWIVQMKIKLKNAKAFRIVSTFTYPLHPAVLFVNSFVIRRIVGYAELANLITFIVSLIACWICCMIVCKLEQRRGIFSILKYSH